MNSQLAKKLIVGLVVSVLLGAAALLAMQSFTPPPNMADVYGELDQGFNNKSYAAQEKYFQNPYFRQLLDGEVVKQYPGRNSERFQQTLEKKGLKLSRKSKVLDVKTPDGSNAVVTLEQTLSIQHPGSDKPVEKKSRQLVIWKRSWFTWQVYYVKELPLG